jgi:hypothetical protein
MGQINLHHDCHGAFVLLIDAKHFESNYIMPLFVNSLPYTSDKAYISVLMPLPFSVSGDELLQLHWSLLVPWYSGCDWIYWYQLLLCELLLRYPVQ